MQPFIALSEFNYTKFVKESNEDMILLPLAIPFKTIPFFVRPPPPVAAAVAANGTVEFFKTFLALFHILLQEWVRFQLLIALFFFNLFYLLTLSN